MQTNALPSRMPTPFADSGTKNTIPVASQIGVTAGLASFVTGFPPLTMTPVAAGGVPPFGADFNGILNAITQAVRWANAGMGYPYDATFASGINGYPKGALIPNSTFTGYWYNSVEGNANSPEATEAVITGWVPAMSVGVTTVGLSGSSIALTSLQASKDRIVLSGALTANVTLYVPAWTRRWLVINNCTGNYSVTVSTPSGSGVAIPVGTTAEIYGDGVNISLLPPKLGVNATAAGHLPTAGQVQNGSFSYGVDNGSASAYTVAFVPAVTALVAGMTLRFAAYNGNGGGATFSPNGLSAKPILTLAQVGLTGGEIIAGGICTVQYSSALDSWILLSSTGGNSLAGRLIRTVVIDGNTAYYPGVQVRRIEVEVVGGGGSGAGSTALSSGNYSVGGGGGAGGYAHSILDVTDAMRSTGIAVTIGQGAAASTGTGSSGGTSSFGSFLSALGGGGGARTVASSSASFISSGGSGGRAASDGALPSGAGEDGASGQFNTAQGSNSQGGAGGRSAMGYGGALQSVNANGNAGTRGGGGGGVLSTSTSTSYQSGAGGNGCCVIREYY